MTAQTFYGDAASVITRTGIEPTDLGLADSGALTTYLAGVLAELTDVFDRYMRKTYIGCVDDSDQLVAVPAGLNGIANDVGAYVIAQQIASRQTPIVRIDDFRVTITAAGILTPDVKERLKLYAPNKGVSYTNIGQDSIRKLPIIFTADQLDGDPADLP